MRDAINCVDNMFEMSAKSRKRDVAPHGCGIILHLDSAKSGSYRDSKLYHIMQIPIP